MAFKFYRFFRLYRITREIKNLKCYPNWEVKPGTTDISEFQVLHSTPHEIPLYAGSLISLDP